MKIVRESIEFKRVTSDRGIKEKLFGWRTGQILVVGSKVPRLLVYGGLTEKEFIPGDKWRIRCLEIGQVAGTPKIAYIHFGFYEDMIIKQESQLRLPTEEELPAIKKALLHPDYQKYIKKAEEKIGAPLFVV